MFPGSPIQSIVDAAKAKSSGSPGPFDSMKGFGGMGGMFKPKPRPQAQSFMGGDQTSSFGGTNVLR